MNQNIIHEALNLLDDSMIETVDAMRNKPKRMKRMILRLGSLAAILCIVFVGIAALVPKMRVENASGSIDYGHLEDKVSTSEEIKEESSVINQSTIHSLRVRIVELTDNGFLAETVKNLGLHDGAIPTKLTVIYADTVAKEVISTLKVGDVVDLFYGCNLKMDTTIYANAIEKTDE